MLSTALCRRQTLFKRTIHSKICLMSVQSGKGYSKIAVVVPQLADRLVPTPEAQIPTSAKFISLLYNEDKMKI